MKAPGTVVAPIFDHGNGRGATGSIQTVSPVLCRYERILMPIADRVGEKLYRKRDPNFLHKHYNAAYPVLSLIEDALLPPRNILEK